MKKMTIEIEANRSSVESSSATFKNKFKKRNPVSKEEE